MLKFFAISTFKHSIYFDGPAKLFSDLYLAKFLDSLAKLFFPFSFHLSRIFGLMFRSGI